MRYFLTTNASRPHNAGGFAFEFEPVSNRGGSWLGVLAVGEVSAANALAGALASGELQGVDEITAERYDGLKKKLTARRLPREGSHVRQNPRTARDVAVARVVEPREETRGSTILDPVARPVVQGSAVQLLVTNKQPPREPLLEQPSMKSGRKFGKAA